MMIFGGGDFGRQLGNGSGGAPVIAFMSLEEEEDSYPFPSAMWGYNKKAMHKPGSRSSPECAHAGILVSDYSLQYYEKYVFHYLNYLMVICYSSWIR